LPCHETSCLRPYSHLPFTPLSPIRGFPLAFPFPISVRRPPCLSPDIQPLDRPLQHISTHISTPHTILCLCLPIRFSNSLVLDAVRPCRFPPSHGCMIVAYAMLMLTKALCGRTRISRHKATRPTAPASGAVWLPKLRLECRRHCSRPRFAERTSTRCRPPGNRSEGFSNPIHNTIHNTVHVGLHMWESTVGVVEGVGKSFTR